MTTLDRTILVDCDGVLMNWEHGFFNWAKRHGYEPLPGVVSYSVSDRLGISKEESNRLVRHFNESAAIAFLPPMRDAIHYVRLLHERHGYVFHMITSMSKDPDAQKLRIDNTEKLFGKTAFEKYLFCDTGDDKHEHLEKYKDTDFFWIEDKIENVQLGMDYGLRSVVMDHPYNKEHVPGAIRVNNWEDFYRWID